MKRIKSRPVQTGELRRHGEERPTAAEEGLRESEVRYRTLFKNSMDAIFITVPDGMIREANQAACEMFGMTEEELIRAGRAGITDPSDRRFATAFEERERSGRFFGELTYLRKDGSSFPAETSSVILDGGAASFVILRDISQRKRAVQELLDSEERYRKLFEVETDAILIVDLETYRLLDANLAAQEMYGYSLEEFLCLTTDDISAEPDRTRQAIVAKQFRVPNRLHRKKDGTVFPVEIAGGYFSFHDREVHVAVIRDMTERTRTEEALKASEERLKLALAAAQMGVWEWDITTDKIFRSEESITIMGGPGLNWTIASFKNVLHPDDAGKVMGAVDQAIADKTVYRSEYRIVRPDGEVRWISDLGRAVYDADNRLVRMVGAVQDITERKQTEKELIDRQNTINNMTIELSVAEERERCRIAEELHDQIAPNLLLGKMRIQSLANLLPANAGDDAVKSIVTIIDQSISEIRSLTLQLRPPILANVGLEAALKWLAHEFEEQYGLKVKIKDDKSQKPLKYEIRSAIFQVVRELLMNVAKHAGTKNAWVTIKKAKDIVDLKVEDDGCGADLASFSREKRQHGGFGIFNAKSKIEFFGGAMSIDSSPGSGTRVFIRAPLDTKPEELEKLS